MAERHCAAGEFTTASKTMQYGRKTPLPHFLFQNPRGVVIRIARMDNQRQTAFARSGDMRAKSSLLRIAG